MTTELHQSTLSISFVCLCVCILCFGADTAWGKNTPSRTSTSQLKQYPKGKITPSDSKQLFHPTKLTRGGKVYKADVFGIDPDALFHDSPKARQLARQGKHTALIGVIGIIVGSAGMGAGAIMMLIPLGNQPQPTLSNWGLGLALGGVALSIVGMAIAVGASHTMTQAVVEHNNLVEKGRRTRGKALLSLNH
jgi:hypothetical protein